jgi:hypothetical protein
MMKPIKNVHQNSVSLKKVRQFNKNN